MIRGRWIALLHAAMAITVTGLPLAAQEPTRPYTVSRLVERALGRFELIASRESVVRQHQALERQALRWRNPELGFELGRKTADGVSGRAYGVSITQHLPLFGRRSLAAEIERFERNKAALDRDGIRLFVRYEVVRLAYDYLRAYRRAAHIRGRLDRLRLINSYMKGRIIVPPQKIVEKRIIEYRVAALEQDLYATDRELRSAYARLNLYTGFEDDDPPPVSAPWFVRAPALELNDLLAKSRERSFAVRMRQEALKAAQGMTALAAREPYPDIGVSLFYHREEAGPAESVFGGGVSFPVPVLSRNREGVEFSREKEKEQEILTEHSRREVEARVRDLFTRYEISAARIARFPVSSRGELERAMRYADEEFRRGRVTLATYLEMDAQTHEMIEMIYSSQVALVRSYTSLLFLAAEERDVGGDTE